MRDGFRPRTTPGMRKASGALLAVLAVALTAYAVFVAVDMATTTYVGWEVEFGRAVLVVATLLAGLAWTGVIMLSRSSRRDR